MHFCKSSAVILALACWLTFSGIVSAVADATKDLLIDDFESDHYQGWVFTGNAFGTSPASGTLANQMPVSGYRGSRLVNTFHQGDGSVGTATSPTFTIEREHIAFLIGGGADIDQVGIE